MSSETSITGHDLRQTDKAFYDDETDYLAPDKIDSLDKHMAQHACYIDAVAASLRELLSRRRNVRMLELGAGTCLTSLLLKKRFAISEVTCADISRKRMETLAPKYAELVGVNLEGVSFVEADFSNPLPFKNEIFDLVVFDAALHHSANIWLTLSQCHRILRPGGVLLALREQYLASATAGFAIHRLLRSPEVEAGVAENAYLREQYAYWLRANGFLPRFLAVQPKLIWRILAPLNGIAFSKWSIWAERQEARPVL
jgi:ubiquinone/menaquinone biosynthesis C-methylase UbiE